MNLLAKATVIEISRDSSRTLKAVDLSEQFQKLKDLKDFDLVGFEKADRSHDFLLPIPKTVDLNYQLQKLRRSNNLDVVAQSLLR